jgi:hypothetical protein
VAHWPSVANSALATILRRLFPTAPAADQAAITALEKHIAQQFSRMVPPGIYRKSVEHGRAVAEHIFAWSRTDGGHEGFRTNFPTNYTPPSGAGLWEPTPPDFQPALQPYWGANRPFGISSGVACDPGPPTPFSADSASAFYAEAREVYDAVVRLTPEQRAIVMFWADGPGATPTPAGHSMSILTQVLQARAASLAVAAEAYAKLGMAVADAFISCWQTKYRLNLLRPITYIQRYIDPTWGNPLPVTTPPFPECTSGHSVQSGAAAQVLTDLFGDVTFTDRTHAERGLPARSFDSFTDFAEEAAISRLYGGIHFRSAIELGLAQGACIGRAVGRLPIRTDERWWIDRRDA